MKNSCFFFVFPFESKGLDLDKFPGNKISNIFFGNQISTEILNVFFWMLGKSEPETCILLNGGEK